MTVRKMDVGDLDGLCSMASRFVGETELPVTYSSELTRKTLCSMMQREYEAIGLVWESDSHLSLDTDFQVSRPVLAGCVLGIVEQDFCYEYCAYISKFYVEKEFRGLAVSLDLLKAFEKEAYAKGAAMIFASSTAGMGETVEKLYVRLFVKAGYNVLGRVLVKECKVDG